MTRNCSKEESDWVLESMLFVIELLTTGTRYLQVALNCNTINTFKKYVSPELESGAVQFL